MSLRDGALINGVPVVVGSTRGGLSPGCEPRIDRRRSMLELDAMPLKASDELEETPPLVARRVGMSLTCDRLEPLLPGIVSPLFRFNLSTAGFVGVPVLSTELRFSPNSSLCFNIFFRKASHVLLIASLSYSENGRGRCLRAVEEPATGGGMGDKGSSIASGEE
jgi:hypothetical protein